MVFEHIEKLKQGINRVIKSNEISVSKNGFVIGDNVLATAIYVEIYLDYDRKRVGFREGNSLTGFKIAKQKNDKSRNIGVNRISNRISPGVYASVEEDGMFVINVDEITRA